MDLTTAPTSFRKPRGAHRCQAARRRPFSSAVLALAVAGGLAAPAAVAAPALAATPDRSTVERSTIDGSASARLVDWQSYATDYGYGSGYGYDDGSGYGYGDGSGYGYGGNGYGGNGYGQVDPWSQQGGGTATQQQEATDASASAEVGMVEITSTLSDGTAAGTGMVLTSGGVVVTNHHVVEGATSIKVTDVSTGQTYTARYVGGDSVHDVAVLQLQGASGLATVSTDSSGVSTGQAVTAVGDANGDGGSLSAADGTVTAQDRSITVQGDDGQPHQLSGLIQVSSDIIPGDSGGALLSSSGRVVGMNVAASSGTSDVEGYVIPISTVLSVVHQITSGDDSGSITLGYPAYLGVALPSDDSTAPTLAGVLDGGAAAGAGLQAGDTITSLDGASVGTSSELRSALAAHDPGDRVQVAWTTASGADRTATVVLGTGPVG